MPRTPAPTPRDLAFSRRTHICLRKTAVGASGQQRLVGVVPCRCESCEEERGIVLVSCLREIFSSTEMLYPLFGYPIFGFTTVRCVLAPLL